MHVDKPSWISFSCKDEQHLHDGSKIKNCVSLFRNHSKVFAVGVNCTNPKYVSEIITNIKANAGDKKIIVYIRTKIVCRNDKRMVHVRC